MSAASRVLPLPAGCGEGAEGRPGLGRVEFPFSHDLDALRNLFPTSSPVRLAHGDLAELTEWGVETRYPGDWPEPTEADAHRAASNARAVYDSVAEEFRRRGVNAG